MWFLNPKYLEFYPKIYPLSEYPERHGHIEYVEHQLHREKTMIEKVSDAIMKYEEANGKKPQIIFLTSEQHKQIDREEKAKAGKKIVPGEEITVETIYGIQIISDEVRALDLRYEKESS